MELSPGALGACTVICLDLLTDLLNTCGRVQFKELSSSQSDTDVAVRGEAGFLQERDPPQTGREDRLGPVSTLWLVRQVS